MMIRRQKSITKKLISPGQKKMIVQGKAVTQENKFQGSSDYFSSLKDGWVSVNIKESVVGCW